MIILITTLWRYVEVWR